MDKLNLDKLRAKMQELNLTENDVIALLDTPMTKGELIIPTPLWVVYKKNNVIILKDGLDLTMKPYVWGIQARPNLLISRLLAEDMPDAKAEWRKEQESDWWVLPHYASKLDYQGGKIVPAKGQDVYCPNSSDYDQTARILQKHGIDCMLWEDERLKSVNWDGYAMIDKVDATSNFICVGLDEYVFTCKVVYNKVVCKDYWVPGRMALWIK